MGQTERFYMWIKELRKAIQAKEKTCRSAANIVIIQLTNLQLVLKQLN